MKFRNLSWLNTPVKIHKFYVLLLALCFYNIAFGQNQPVTVSANSILSLKIGRVRAVTRFLKKSTMN